MPDQLPPIGTYGERGDGAIVQWDGTSHVVVSAVEAAAYKRRRDEPARWLTRNCDVSFAFTTTRGELFAA